MGCPGFEYGMSWLRVWDVLASSAGCPGFEYGIPGFECGMSWPRVLDVLGPIPDQRRVIPKTARMVPVRSVFSTQHENGNKGSFFK